MATNTTARGYRYPDGVETPALDILFGHLAQDVDADVQEIAATQTALKDYVTDTGTGGASLTVAYTTATDAASVTITPGTWHVTGSQYYLIRTAAQHEIDTVLWNTTTGAAVGATDTCSTATASTYSNQTRHVDEYVTVAVPTVLTLRGKTAALDDLQQFGANSLRAHRIA